MDFKFKKNAEPQGSGDGFWYDLVDGGYIKPEEVLADKKQLIKLKEAINIVRRFKIGLENNNLLNEI